MRENLNCPNCGQPITSEKCEYCGTVFLDFANVKFDHGLFEETYLRLNLDGNLFIAKVLPTDLTFETQPGPFDGFPLFSPAQVVRSNNVLLSLNFYLLPDENDVMLKQIRNAEGIKK